MRVMIIVAHPDDEVLGCGGAIASYNDNGDEVISIIFTYGENADLKGSPKKLADKRSKESIRAGKILGIKKMYFLGVPDTTLTREIKNKKLFEKMESLLKKHKPDIILTHSKDDYHPAHRNVAKLVKKLVEKMNIKTRIYTFTIGSPVRTLQKNMPKLVIDISKYRHKKKEAIQQFKSQYWNFHYFGNLSKWRDFFYGKIHDRKAVEVFYKW